MSVLSGRNLAAILFAVLMGVSFAAPCLAQDDGETPAPAPLQPDPNKTMTVDFVQKDIHTVMHYIALRSGLKIIVEGTVTVKLTVMFPEVKPIDAIRAICKANKLDFIEDGEYIIIKARQSDAQLANVVAGGRGVEGMRFTANFEEHPLVRAIMEVGTITSTDVYVPAVPVMQDGRQPEDQPQGQQGGQLVEDVQSRKISMYMRDATPGALLSRLADLGDMDVKETSWVVKVTVTDPEGKTREEEQTRYGYMFTYRIRIPSGPSGGMSGTVKDEDIKSRAWTLPGVEIGDLKTEVANLLSSVGKVVIDKSTSYLAVFDLEANVKRVEGFIALVEAELPNKVATAEAAKAGEAIVVREYRITRNASEPAIQAALQGVMTDRGRVVVNQDRNSLIVWETKANMALVDELMKSMDTAPEQVLITAKLIEVTLDSYMGYGLELFTSQPADNLNDGVFTGSSEDSTSGTVGGLFGQPTGFDPFFGTFSNPRLDIRLELLANDGRVKTLSQPTQMVSNRRRARIEVGQEIPYLEASSAGGGTTTATVSFKEVSIVMDVIPTVLEGGLVRLEVTMTVREVIGNIAIEGNNTPILSKRESRTDVFINDGETLVMGGLMRERERTDENGLPFLKDIPIIGYLFKSANKSTSKTDLLFFVRPTIVSAKGPRVGGELDLERDIRPIIYADGDEKKADIRQGRYRKMGVAPKPAWYNDKNRPKSPKDVNPGA